LPNGTAGTAYSQTLAATGDTPITWSLESGALPTGLNLLGSGTISGTPTTAEKSNFTVKATNAAGSGTKTLSVVIASSSGVVYGAPLTYGDETYQTVVIGAQTWLARNLNYAVEGGSKCYGDDQTNRAKYGLLYNWETALAICPEGWRLPGNDDWDKLFRYVDNVSGSGLYQSTMAGKYLKAASGWYNNGNGTDRYGFSALPGGYSGSSGLLNTAECYGYWWSSSGYDSNRAYYRGMNYDRDGAGYGYGPKATFFSVRFVKDN
jgi:uncharacterized protein (TIGR02145 family)